MSKIVQLTFEYLSQQKVPLAIYNTIQARSLHKTSNISGLEGSRLATLITAWG